LDVNIFPNPTADRFELRFDRMTTGVIDVFALNGQKVMSRSVNAVSSVYLNASDLTREVYIVEVTTAHAVLRKKLIVR